MNTLKIGNRRELFIDNYLVDRFVGEARQRLHSPIRREAALVTDQPWEGCMGGFPTIVKAGRRFRMYYRGWQINLDDFDGVKPSRPPTLCLAESLDGIHWERLPVNAFDYAGNTANNIVWMGVGDDLLGMHGFSPFQDTNPDCRPDQCWKAVGGGWRYPHKGLYLLASPDGIQWSLVSDQPFLAGYALDSDNTVRWSPGEGCYRIYFRHWSEGVYKGVRNIMTATSDDLRHWSEPVELDFNGAPPAHLYDNNVISYHRAPHIWLGFPTRYTERPWSPSIEALPELEHRRRRANLKERFGTALTEPLLMCSRDARVFHRWEEAFMRPGLCSEGNWAYGDNYFGWGLLETDSDQPGGGKELSLYATEHYWRGESTTLRRCTLRMDGFVSINAPMKGGELVTRPLTFTGARLSLNISTSAAGGARVEIQDADGKPLPGFAADDCWEIVGDTLDYTVCWKQGTDLASLSGRPVCLRFVLRDTDLYSMCFE
jgi:hypothetical protein